MPFDPFYQNCFPARFLSLQLCDECGYIGITLIRVACGGKQFPYKNYILESAFFQIVCNLLVLVGTVFTQLPHISQYQHFVFGLHVPEVTNGSHHACGIGIIGIDNQSVVRCFFQL